jgi:chromosome segregation ATPase
MSSSPTNSELLDVSGASTDFVRTNPTMDRIRLTLKQQLVQTRDRIRLEVIEQEDALKEAKREREDAGIELYGVQQQLSRIQSSLKTIDKRYDAVSTERVEGQKKVVEAKEVYAGKQKISESLRKVAAKRQEELEAILEKISQAKKYNEAMKSEVAVTRTVANKTNEDLKTRAKDKLTQDTYIDSLNSQVTRLEDDMECWCWLEDCVGVRQLLSLFASSSSLPPPTISFSSFS